MPAKVGDMLPDATLSEGVPDSTVKIQELFAGKKGVLFGVPGAFTPGCSKTHLPGYVKDYEKLKAAGAEVIVCVATNDPFVMAAWGENQGAGDKVRLLSDMNNELTRGLDIELPILNSVRCKRFSAVIEDNIIKSFNLEEGPDMACSLSNVILEQLSNTK